MVSLTMQNFSFYNINGYLCTKRQQSQFRKDNMNEEIAFCCKPEPNRSEKQFQSLLEILEHGLFSISPINKSINRDVLSMIYSPGVGAVCTAIKTNPQLVDKMTLRGRSVAIVSDGSFMNCSETKITPILNWFVAQIKFYTGIDGFPFAIRKESKSRIREVFKDLSTSYAIILYLDDDDVIKQYVIPENTLVVKQSDIVNLLGCQKTDAEVTARVISCCHKKQMKGLVCRQQIQKGICYTKFNFKKQNNYFSEFKDGRNLEDHSLEIHQTFQGKVQIQLSFYSIQIIKHCFSYKNLIRLINTDTSSYNFKKCCGIISDGTAILGLGAIGPKAGLPVMQGKSVLFKVLGNVDVIPICIHKRSSPHQTVEAILDLLAECQAINLEDIKAPECFFVEEQLNQKQIMPVFHDDQHGTAIICLSALINALKVSDKKISECKLVVNGAGAAGITIVKILLAYGFDNITVCDRGGAIYQGRQNNMNLAKQNIAKFTNKNHQKGNLEEVIKNADIFIGVSSGGVFSKQFIKTMKQKSIIFAMANPIPQITLQEAQKGGVYIYGSGRSDYKNQINNSLVFPGIFRAIHEHKLKNITEEMKIVAAQVIADSLDKQPNPNYIIPENLDKDVPIRISKAFHRFKK